jgi:hypothetical protein
MDILSIFSGWSWLHLSQSVEAASLAISLQVGDTRVIFSGYSSPGAYISITQNSNVIGTTTADSNGAWSKEIVAVNPGIDTFTISGLDTAGRTIQAISYNLNLLPNVYTQVDNISLPPTVSLYNSVLSGASYPSSQITLLSSSGDSYSTLADSLGAWQYSLASTVPGTFTLTVRSTVLSSYISENSTIISYTIVGTSTQTSTGSSPSSSATLLSPSPSITPSASMSPVPRNIRPTKEIKELSPATINQLGKNILEYTIARSVPIISLIIFVSLLITIIRRKRQLKPRKNRRTTSRSRL